MSPQSGILKVYVQEKRDAACTPTPTGRPTADTSGRSPGPTIPTCFPLGHRLLRAVSERIRWRGEINAARERVAAGPPNLLGNAIDVRHPEGSSCDRRPD
jgi:hypothetical protein